MANIPYLIGYLAQTDSLRFAWVTILPEDQLSYFAKMNQGRLGSWVLHLPYTAQPHEGGPVYLFYLFLGHVSRWLGLPVQVIYHLVRLFVGLAFFLTAYKFIQQLTDDRALRRFSFLLVAFAGGLGWFMMIIGHLRSADLTIPDANTFLGLMGPPQIILGQTLQLIFWLTLLQVATHTELRKAPLVIAALANGILALTLPFQIAVTLGTAALFILLVWVAHRQFPKILTIHLGLSAMVAVPLVVFTAYVLNHDPVFRSWMQQNELLSPPPIYYLSGYGLLLMPALLGLKVVVQQKRRAHLLLLAWLIVILVGLYAPTTFQKRFSNGLHPLMALLATVGAGTVLAPRLTPLWRRRGARVFLAAASITTLVVMLVFSFGSAARDPRLFYTSDEVAAFSWLRQNAPVDAVVLSSTELGAFIPAFTHQRAVSGHGFETVNAEETEADVTRFFSLGTTLDERRRLLDAWNVDYVIWGPREGTVDARATVEDPLMELVAERGTVRVYRLTPARLGDEPPIARPAG